MLNLQTEIAAFRIIQKIFLQNRDTLANCDRLVTEQPELS